MIDKKKRTLPRHVEERVMIGLMPFKTLVHVAPLYIATIILLFMFFTPITLMIGIIILGGITYLFSEIQDKETGLVIIKDTLRYRREGNIHFERSCLLRNEIDRITWNKIKKGNH